MNNDFLKLILVCIVAAGGFYGYQGLKSKTQSRNVATNVTRTNPDIDLGRASFSPDFAKSLSQDRNSPEKVKQAIKKLVD